MMAKLLAKLLKKNSLDITFQKTRCIVLAQCHVSGGGAQRTLCEETCFDIGEEFG